MSTFVVLLRLVPKVHKGKVWVGVNFRIGTKGSNEGYGKIENEGHYQREVVGPYMTTDRVKWDGVPL